MARALRIFGRPAVKTDGVSTRDLDRLRSEAEATFAKFDLFLADVLEGRPPAVFEAGGLTDPSVQPDFEWAVVERWRVDNLLRYEAVLRNIDTVRTFANLVHPANYRRVTEDARALMSDLARELHRRG